jgi:hypothetical protein
LLKTLWLRLLRNAWFGEMALYDLDGWNVLNGLNKSIQKGRRLSAKMVAD